MNEERMLILKMVAEGKMTPEEADSLLQTLEEIDNPIPGSPSPNWQENIVEGLKSGAETLKRQALNMKAEVLKNQDSFLREQKDNIRQAMRHVRHDIVQGKHNIKQSMRHVQHDIAQERNPFHHITIEDEAKEAEMKGEDHE